MTLFVRSVWRRVFRKLRRRPTSPIRRDGQLKFELVRLDDRIAPGNVLASAAAGAVGLAGPLAWVGLSDPELAAIGPAWATAPVVADSGSLDVDPMEVQPAFFSRTVPDSSSTDGSANAPDIFDSAPVSGGVLTDLGEPGEPGASATGGPSQWAVAPPTGGGGSSAIGAPDLATGRSGGFAVSGGLPAHPTPETTTPISPSPLRGGGGGRGSGTAATPNSPVANAPGAPKPLPKPSGHFAAQLQALLHSNDTGGTFNLTDTANQQSQIGALVGGQLTNAAGLGTASTASHRPASLLGQALADGSNKNLGLRTSNSSTGTFGLVGSQSISDLMTSHAPSGSGLAGGAAAIANAIPVNGSAPLPSPLKGTSRPTAPSIDAPGVGLIVLAAPSSRPPGDPAPTGDGGDGGEMTPMLGPDATFTLTIPGYGYQFVETGTFSIPSDWSGGNTTWLNVLVHAWVNGNDNPTDGMWGEYAYPAVGAYGFDLAGLELFNSNLDAFNAMYFYEYANNSNPGYALTLTAATPFVGSDNSAPTEQSGTVTTARQNYYATIGTDAFSVSFAGPAGASRVLVRDDTVNATYGGNDSGSQTDSANPATSPVTNDTFTNAVSNGTSTEVDHTEGTIAADGTFQLTSFSIDSTSDEDFTDSVTGSTHTPESGGSESDTFTDTDSGHDHEHLHAEGSPTNWTASFDDTDHAGFTDGDNGSESSSQTASGTTDTNGDTFHADDGGTHDDVLHLAGSGTATTFTATAVSDRIEDAYHYHDSDGGTAGEAKTGETDSDAYTATDNGDADEVLTVAGDANSLTAGYTDLVHDGFTDGDNINDGWSGGGDSGSDHSTDGDGGNETVNMSAHAGMANWQADSTTTPAPTWEITSVGADITGLANVHAGDDGTDTNTSAANAADSDFDHFVDSSLGTDTFGLHLVGDGTTATLTPSSTYAIATHSDDDNTGRWTDPDTIDNQAGTDGGIEEIDYGEDGSDTIGVGETESIAADGTITVSASHVDVGETGSAHETDNGTDDQWAATDLNSDDTVEYQGTSQSIAHPASAIDDLEQIHDTAQFGLGVQMHTDTAGGTTTVGVDRNILNGTVGMGGSVNDTDRVDPADIQTDVDQGSITGAVGGHLHQSGTVAGDQVLPGPASGDVGVNLTGGGTRSTVETITSTPNAPRIFPTINFQDVTDMAIDLPAFATSTSPTGTTTVTTTHTITVPSYHLTEDDTETGNAWSLADIDYGGRVTDTTAIVGNYAFGLLAPGGSQQATKTETTTTNVSEETTPTGLSGGQIRTWTLAIDAGNVTISDPAYHGSASAKVRRSTIDTISGSIGNLTQVETQGSDSLLDSAELHYNLIYTIGGTWTYDLNETHKFSETALSGSPQVLTDTTGHDWRKIITHSVMPTADGGQKVMTITNEQTLDKNFIPGGQVVATPAGTTWYDTYIYDSAGNLVSHYTPNNPEPPAPDPNRDWLAKMSDFSAGMADAISCGLTQRIRSAAGYDDVVDKNSLAYKGGEVAGTAVALATGGVTACGRTALIAASARTLSVVQGVGSAINAGESAANGDYLSAGLNAVGAFASFGKATTACFAAGVPLHDTWTTAKPIEQFQVADTILSRDENDPVGLPVLKQVEEVFVGQGRILHLHAGGQVIRTTAMHPFWVTGKGWVEAERLQLGDRLGSHDGQSVAVEELYDTGETETVYNLRVAEYHTYFVGSPEWGWSAWAHNACAKPIGGTRPAHGSPDHNGRLVKEAQKLLGHGNTTVRTNQALVDAAGSTISNLRPDVQFIENSLINVIEVNVSGGPGYHLARESQLREALGALFGKYTGINI